MLERVEASLDLMITLKDALQYYDTYLQEHVQKCKEAEDKIPGLINRIEELVAQETGVMQEVGSVREQLVKAKEKHQSLQEDLTVLNDLERLEHTIREREEARNDLLRRLNIGTSQTEATKLLDLDIEAHAEFRQHQLDLLKERGVDRNNVRPMVEGLEGTIASLSKALSQKEDQLREIAGARLSFTGEFSELKSATKERHIHEQSLTHLQELIEVVGQVPLGGESVTTEAEAPVEEGVVQC